jgi:hypothetical protein
MLINIGIFYFPYQKNTLKTLSLCYMLIMNIAIN